MRSNKATELLRKLNIKHPLLMDDYTREFLRDSYTGKGGYNSNLNNRDASVYGRGSLQTQSTQLVAANYYLNRFYRENAADFNNRLKEAHYVNYTSPIIDLYNDFVFRRPIHRRTTSSNISSWIDQHSINALSKEVMLYAQLFGMAWVIVDAENVAGAANELEAKQLGYNGLQANILDPSSILNFDASPNGEIHFIKYKTARYVTDSPLDEPHLVVEYRVWTKDTWEVYREEKNGAYFVESGSNPFGMVPVAVCRWNESMSNDFICDTPQALPLAINNRAIYNRMNELEHILRGQSFSLLTIPNDNPQIDEIQIGVSSVLFTSVEGNTPQFISPDAKNAECYMSYIGELDRAQFRIASLEFLRTIEGTRMQGNISSGIGRRYSFAQANAKLVNAGRQIAKFEHQLFGIIGAYYDETPEVEIQYANNYDIGAEETDLLNLKEAIANQLPDYTITALKRNLSISLLDPTEKEIALIDSQLANSLQDSSQPRNESLPAHDSVME